MSAAEVAADLRAAAEHLRSEEWEAPDGDLAERVAALADSFDQEGQLGFDRATGEMVALVEVVGPIDDGWSRTPSWWCFPPGCGVSSEEPDA